MIRFRVELGVDSWLSRDEPGWIRVGGTTSILPAIGYLLGELEELAERKQSSEGFVSLDVSVD